MVLVDLQLQLWSFKDHFYYFGLMGAVGLRIGKGRLDLNQIWYRISIWARRVSKTVRGRAAVSQTKTEPSPIGCTSTETEYKTKPLNRDLSPTSRQTS